MSFLPSCLDHARCTAFLLATCSVLLLGRSTTRAQPMDYDLSAREGRAQLVIDSVAAHARSLDLAAFKASDCCAGGKYGAYLAMALFEKKDALTKARRFAAQQLVGGGDMFREYTTMALYMQYHRLYGKALRQKVKQDQLESNFYRPGKRGDLGGASENHKLMYAAAAYLGGRAWPEDYPQRWYEAGRDYLKGWFEEVTELGFWEQDSPTYTIHHMGPLLSVAEHAPEGSEMKRMAEMTLDWYFASMAGEYLHGYWITAAARDYDPLFGLERSAETTALTWLAFGDAPFAPEPNVDQPLRHWKATLHFAASEEYRVPQVLRQIATDRDEPFVHREYMVRNPMHPHEYSYIAPRYGVASIVGEGENIPPDMTRWKVQWVPEKRSDEPSTFLMKHPEPGTDTWRAWRGASPAERVLQHRGTLLAVYRIAEGWKPFIEGPVSEGSYEAVRHDREHGWLFLHAGPVLLAVKATDGLRFSGERGGVRLLRSDGRRNGLIVETASVGRYGGSDAEDELARFRQAILRRTTVDAAGVSRDRPRLRYISLRGDTLAITHGGERAVNGEAITFSGWPLLDDPWIHQDVGASAMHRVFPMDKDPWKQHDTGAAILRLEHGDRRRVYNFETWTVRSTLEEEAPADGARPASSSSDRRRR